MRDADISVVVVAYKASSFIDEALKSIERQSEKNWEVIVVEDGSFDGTSKIVSEFARRNPRHRVAYRNNRVNRGVSFARNRAIELVATMKIAFLDADDIWREDHLKSISIHLEDNAPLAFSGLQIWDTENSREREIVHPSELQISLPAKALFRESFIQTSSSVGLLKTVFLSVGTFDERLQIGEDRDLWFRVAYLVGGLKCTRSTSCRYRKHQSSSMSKTALVARQEVLFYKKHYNSKCVAIPLRRRLLANAMRNAGRLSRRLEPRSACKIFIDAWKTWPFGVDLPLRALLAIRASGSTTHIGFNS